ncbi:MAG TPA: hypothetical protein VFU43_24185 [Streptosporangiaceae bacterium]|nr:hypothetical protein [Streptosporangiaceae bacterium]
MNETTAQTAPTHYTVTVDSTDAGRAQIAVGTETITLDTAWPSTPSGLPGPAELLAAAFAACLLFVDIAYELRLDTDEPAQRVDLLHRNLRRYGTVYNTLAAACHVHGSIVTGPTTEAP